MSDNARPTVQIHGLSGTGPDRIAESIRKLLKGTVYEKAVDTESMLSSVRDHENHPRPPYLLILATDDDSFVYMLAHELATLMEVRIQLIQRSFPKRP